MWRLNVHSQEEQRAAVQFIQAVPFLALLLQFPTATLALQRQEKKGISKTAGSFVPLLSVTKDKLCATDARLQGSKQD